VDFTLIKGDIADTGTAEQFALARRTFAAFERPHHVMLGNHDLCPEPGSPSLDGHALLQAPPCPRAFEHGGWLFVLLDSVRPGHHGGSMELAQLEFLQAALASEPGMPTVVFTHHHLVCRGEDTYFPNTIGIPPEQSHRLFELVGRHPQIKAVLSGHSHRSNLRTYPESGDVPFIEVAAVKDYPGVFATYRLFDDGELRQEVRRIESPTALNHVARCSGHIGGLYRRYALGRLGNRSVVTGGTT
jgi:3',5'-cyclic AMP phosphodiesterase CpdA